MSPAKTKKPPRQPDKALERENAELRERLARVLATAAENEAIWRHFAEIERILFRTRELDQLVEELLREIKVRFEPDQVVLLVCHPDLAERFFPDSSAEIEPLGDGTWMLPFPLEIGQTLCSGTPKPFLLTPETIDRLLNFLPETVAQVQSGVLIPLCIHEVLFGGLFLGSTDAARYNPGDGTELLEQLGIKIALCLDNCLTYEKVKEFAIEDRLTGLLSFFQIQALLEREFRKARRSGAPLSVLIVDLDFFHETDEQPEVSFGILRHVAELLTRTLPENASYLGRYGSDEFLIVFPDASEAEAREVVPYLAQKIRKHPFRYANTAVLVQAVIGVGTIADSMRRSQELLDAASVDLCRLKMLKPQISA